VRLLPIIFVQFLHMEGASRSIGTGLNRRNFCRNLKKGVDLDPVIEA
jgi:hypothetical protein